MKRLLLPATLALGLGLVASPAHATTFTVDLLAVTYNGSPNGLTIDITNLNTPPTFSLSLAGDSTGPIPVFTISSPTETEVDGDDLVPQPIDVEFDFSAPPGISGDVTGSTSGFYTFNPDCFPFFTGGCGEVTWNNPVLVPFGSGGLLAISLSDVMWQTPEGSAEVDATFTLRDADPVPEPASMVLLGTGLVGLVALRRRFV